MSTLTLLYSVVPLPLLPLPVCSPLVHLADAGVLISPGSRLTPAQYASAGRITDVVAPNLGHTAGMKLALAQAPAARIWGPEGIAARRPSLAWTGTLTLAAWPYQDELPLHALDGLDRLREVVFLHKASRTLIATDLCFNLLGASGLFQRLLLTMTGTWRRFAVSRLFLQAVTDRARFDASVRALLAWEFDDIVVSHGDPVKGNGRARLLAALQERGFCLGMS